MQSAEHVETTLRHHDDGTEFRVRAEFMEMPGLKLTIPQAARLFNLDAARCARVFDALVSHGVLAAADGTFMRADSDRRAKRFSC